MSYSKSRMPIGPVDSVTRGDPTLTGRDSLIDNGARTGVKIHTRNGYGSGTGMIMMYAN